MSQVAQHAQDEGVAERRAQSELTDRVAVRLVRRSKARNLRWSTWRWRLGVRGKP